MQAKDLDPSDRADGWWNIGLAYEYDDQFDKALTAFRKAREQDPTEDMYAREIEKVEQRRSRIPTYLRTHPPSSERRSVAEQAAGQGGPAMSEGDWRAIRALCRANGG